jgi:phosphatidylinositol glycan class Z
MDRMKLKFILSWQMWITIAQNIVTTVFFGMLHQAGVIPTMLDVHDHLCNHTLASYNNRIQIVVWRSFMPPRHLILPAGKGGEGVSIDDRQSMPVELLAETLSSDPGREKILLGPSWALNKDVEAYFQGLGISLAPLTRSYLHLDTDHLGESISEYRKGRSSLFESFSYAAWSVEHVADTTAQEE